MNGSKTGNTCTKKAADKQQKNKETNNRQITDK
jgi:hypothetical protein